MNPEDNVATALKEIECGEYIQAEWKLAVREKIPAGFKVSLADLKKGDSVIKYGYPIGIATVLIAPGDIVHTHNITSTVKTRS